MLPTDPLYYPDKLEQPGDCILNHEPEEAVDLALEILQESGIMLVEWHSLLYRRMNVPVGIRNFSYLVPDESLSTASSILSTMNLLLSPCSICPSTSSDFIAKGRFHRITRSTSPALVQHLVLYPLSFSTLSVSELQEDVPLYATVNSRLRCRSVYVPTAPAIYASIIRMMLNYPQLSPTSIELRSELSGLIVYDLLGYDLLDLKVFCVDAADWEAEDAQERIEKAAWTIKHWGVDCVWREEEEWIGDALALFMRGKGKLECLPYSSPLHPL